MPKAEPMPTVNNSTQSSTEDTKALIRAYLASKNKNDPSNADFAMALKANSDNPGLIPGLTNMEPISSPGDPGYKGPMPKKSGGGGGGAAKQPQVPQRSDRDENRDAYAAQNAPAKDDSGGLTAAELALMIGGGGGALAYALNRKQGKGVVPATDPVPIPEVTIREQPRLTEEPRLRIGNSGGPAPAAAAPDVMPMGAPEVDPAKAAMDRAVAPNVNVNNTAQVTPQPIPSDAAAEIASSRANPIPPADAARIAQSPAIRAGVPGAGPIPSGAAADIQAALANLMRAKPGAFRVRP